ncbi:MAG: CRISPR-associated helicase Cas3' [Bacteroidales bacterium]
MPLESHLKNVSMVAISIAKSLNMDENIARRGAILHDIGKVSPLFQQTLKRNFIRPPGFVFRHEIASLFFLSVLEENEKDIVIDMIIAHHKSMYKDIKGKGFLDLDDNMDSFTIHSKGFEQWSVNALSILSSFGFDKQIITIEEAKRNYDYALTYCEVKGPNCSPWKGLLMAADHTASALEGKTKDFIDKLFIQPDLSFYNRVNNLYPLSNIITKDSRKHTLVTAPTGAGKTDFLLRRCQGRVFYTLPFQASINAMYDRIKEDLQNTNAQVYLLHATSSLKIEDGQAEERILQRNIGASVKVMTPHQMASIVFGIKGYEAMSIDLKGCDVILDEIHTYASNTQAIVLKIVEILIALDCRIHIGTATMSNVLYNRILNLLGGENNVYEVKLSTETLKTFDRHIIYKIESFKDVSDVIENAIKMQKKILIVCNQVRHAQQIFEELKNQYVNVQKMLIHSKFKRCQRQKLESQLTQCYNTMSKACIVVSTQIVEVSLDINFDLLITECAPIDALIQRFGRINRKRTLETIGNYKSIYVIKPSNEKREALPYDLEILNRSFKVLPNGNLLKENTMQEMLDVVYPEVEFLDIDLNTIFTNGEWQLKELCHYSKSALLEILDINSVVCITESDEQIYMSGNKRDCSAVEIPVSYNSVAYKKLKKLDKDEGLHPFIVPDKAYSDEEGLQLEYVDPLYYKAFEII